VTWAPSEYQKRVYEILTGDANLMALVTGVFDNVPQGQAFPYIKIGDDEFSDRGSHTTEGWSADLMIHVWAQGPGRKSVHTVMSHIDRLLHNKDLTAPGWTEVSFRRDFSTVFVEDDHVTYHGVIRFKLLTGEV
jgi:hypothetical protein